MRCGLGCPNRQRPAEPVVADLPEWSFVSGGLIGRLLGVTANMRPSTREWLVDVLVGGLGGAIVGGILAVNLVIFSGNDRGYEASIDEVFRQNVLLGVAVVALWIAGPVFGVIGARRSLQRRGGA